MITLVVERDKTILKKKMTIQKPKGFLINTKFGEFFNATAFAKVKDKEFQRCDVCMKSTVELGKHLLACAACKKARYCSSQCQKIGWKQLGHNKVCKELKAAKCDTSKRLFKSSLLKYMATFGSLGRKNSFQMMRDHYTVFQVHEMADHYVCRALENIQAEKPGTADLITGGVTWHIPLNL